MVKMIPIIPIVGVAVTCLKAKGVGVGGALKISHQPKVGVVYIYI